MPVSADSKVEEFRNLKIGPLRVLALHIDQVPSELGDAEQTVKVELLKRDYVGKFVLVFKGVQDLRIDRLQPGVLCMLYIESKKADQLEGLLYRVCNPEQDLTLSFYCRDFIVESRS